MAPDQIGETELADISNFSYDELGGIKKIGGNKVVFVSTTDYTVTIDDTVVVGDGNVTLTLPDAAGIDDKVYWLGNVGNGIVIISPVLGQMIGDRYDKYLYGRGDYIRIVACSGNWLLMGQNFAKSGAIAMWGAETPPAGWVARDGSAISRSIYAELFETIGTRHGVGDGVTTFNVPDLRGRFERGWDNTAGQDPDSATRTSPFVGFVLTGDTLPLDPVVTDIVVTDLFIGMGVAGTGIAVGSEIIAIGTTTITLSLPATLNQNDVMLTFSVTGDHVGTKQAHALQDHTHSQTATNADDAENGVQDETVYNGAGSTGLINSGANTSTENRPRNDYYMPVIKL
jgi:microcystin-dependent protein